jgi:hypothetical protein
MHGTRRPTLHRKWRCCRSSDLYGNRKSNRDILGRVHPVPWLYGLGYRIE